jgi:hypothetical protein
MLFIKITTTIWGLLMFISCFLQLFTADSVSKRVLAFINGLAVLALIGFSWGYAIWRV